MSNPFELVQTGKTKNNDLIGAKLITAEDQILLNAMNTKYSHVVIGGKHRIMTSKNCPINGKKMSFESPSEFYNYFAHEPLMVGYNKGVAWFKWPGKEMYPEGVGYYPCEEKLPKGTFNTFQPFPCEPVKGDVSLILDHIHNVLCDGNKEASDYFLQWLAHIFQKPMEKPTVAILMKSSEGTGKGTLYRLLANMLGTNAHQVNGGYQLVGRFNSILIGRLLVFGDEVDLSEKRVFDRVKGIISEPTLSMELKGIDAEPMPNYTRLIFTGNHDKMLAAGTRERRFLVLEPSTHRIDDSQYWQKLNAVIDAHGASAFLEYLSSIDLTSFSAYKAPATTGLIEEKIANFKPSLAYLYAELQTEKGLGCTATIGATALVDGFIHWAEINHISITPSAARSQIGKTMKDLGIKQEGRSGRGSGIIYKFPGQEIMKEKFAQSLGHQTNDIF